MAESIAPNGSPSRRQDLAYCFDCQESFPDQETLRRHQNYMNQYRDREESHPRIVSSRNHGVTNKNNRINEQQSRETAKAKGKRERSAQNHGQSNSNKTQGSSNGPDKEKNVLKKISLPCPRCKSVFDREDEFKLHHALKHAKYGDPPAVTPIVDIISKPPPEEKSNVIQQRRKSDVLRTPRPNVSYNLDQASLNDSSRNSGSSDSDEKKSDISKSSTNTSKKNDEREKQPGKIYRTKSNKRINSSCNETSSYKENSNSDHNTDKSDKATASTKKKYKTKHKRLGNCSKSGSNSEPDCCCSCRRCEKSHEALMLIVLKSSKSRKMFKKLLKARHRKKLLQKHSKRDKTIKCQKCKVGIAKLDFERHMKMCKKIRRGKNNDSGIPSSESEDHSSNSKAEETINKKKDKKKSKTPDRAKSATSDGDSRKRKASQHSEAEDINNDTRKRDHANIESDKQKPKTPNREGSSEDVSHNKQPRLEEPSQQNMTKKRKVRHILYRCDECDGHFMSKKSLLAHIKPGTHYDGVKNPECPECKLKFGSKKILNDHRKLHHERLKLTRNDFTILTNDVNFETKKPSKPQPSSQPTVKAAATPINTVKPINSASVPQNLPSTSGLQNLNAQHPKPSNAQSKADRTLFKCEFCTAHFLKRSAVHSHLKNRCFQSRPNKVMSNCEYCNLKFSRWSVNIHKNNHHKQMKLSTKDFIIIVCKPKRAGSKKKMVSNTTPQNSEIGEMSPTTSKEPCVVKFTKNNDNAWSVASSSKNINGNTKSDNTELTAADTAIVTPTSADTREEAVSQNTDCIETASNTEDNANNNNSTPTEIQTETHSVTEPTAEKVAENVELSPNVNNDETLNEGGNDESTLGINIENVFSIKTETNNENETKQNPHNSRDDNGDIKLEIKEEVDEEETRRQSNVEIKREIIKTENIKTENVVSNFEDFNSNSDNQSLDIKPGNNIFSTKCKDEITSNAGSEILTYEEEDIENTIKPEPNNENVTESTSSFIKLEIKEEVDEEETRRQSNVEIKREIIKTEQDTQNVVSNCDDFNLNSDNQSLHIKPGNNIFSTKCKDEIASNANSEILKYEEEKIENTIKPEPNIENATEQNPHNFRDINGDVKPEINEKYVNKEQTESQLYGDIKQEIIKSEQNTQNDQSAEVIREMKEEPNCNDHHRLSENDKVVTNQETVHDNVTAGPSSSAESNVQKDELKTHASQNVSCCELVEVFIQDLTKEISDLNTENKNSKQDDELVDLTDDAPDDNLREFKTEVEYVEVSDDDIIEISDIE